MSRLNPVVAIFLADTACIFVGLSLAGLWTGHGHESPARIVAGSLTITAIFGSVWLLVAQRMNALPTAPDSGSCAWLLRTAESWALAWGLASMLATSIAHMATRIAHTPLQLWAVFVLAGTLILLLRLPLWAAAQAQRPLRAAPGRRVLTLHTPLASVGAPSPPGGSQLRRPWPLDPAAELSIASAGNAAAATVAPAAQGPAVSGGAAVAARAAAVDRGPLLWPWPAPIFALAATPQRRPTLVVKRLLDALGAATGIILLLPVLLACAAAVKLTSKGPVLFCQTRVGRNGRHFQCFKFRTMRVGAHLQQELLRANSLQDGPAFKVAGDPRVTPIGRFLRKFSLDELPQLLNVLRGDMSLVGPRPPVPNEVVQYAWWQRRRLAIKPGLTCLWQVYGRSRVSFKRWMEMDLYYIDNWSIWMDLKLICHTFRAVLRGTGM